METARKMKYQEETSPFLYEQIEALVKKPEQIVDEKSM